MPHEWDKWPRADWEPALPEILDRDVALESCAYVARRETAPHDVGEKRRDMIERAGRDASVVGHGEHCQTRPETRAHDPDTLETLRDQPIDDALGVEHGLPVRVQRPADVGTDDELGAREVRRPPLVVVRQTQPDGGQTKTREQLAQAHVASTVGIPLRQHEDGAAWSR